MKMIAGFIEPSSGSVEVDGLALGKTLLFKKNRISTGVLFGPNASDRLPDLSGELHWLKRMIGSLVSVSKRLD